MLSEEQIHRYSRQILLSEIGGEGQELLQKAKVLCVGVGGLGSPASLYLTAAGVGTIGLVDRDPVEISNLHRQILHYTTDIGRHKVNSAKTKLKALNEDININVHRQWLDESNALELFSHYDIVMDGSDNFITRYLINDACVLLKKPLVSAAVLKWEGQITTIIPHEGHCYRCLFPEPPDPKTVKSCSEVGILGGITGVLGSLQALEAIKIILKEPGTLKNQILQMNFSLMTFRKRAVIKREDCHICGRHPTIKTLNPIEKGPVCQE